jgi:catechol 2,3-dioxygenase-like lactoylglutathione lyase family enzyme
MSIRATAPISTAATPGASARADMDKKEWTMPIATLRGVTLDCADPRALARFYQELTGMEPSYDTDGFVALAAGSGCDLGFQRVHGYRRPQWPGQDVPQQFHLDFQVEDLDAAEKLALGLGAVRPDHQPGDDRWRVLLDPAGHPFCLTAG